MKKDTRGNKGHSTRYKYKSLPKYVHLFQHPKSKKVFRVMKKVDGKAKTFGYFKELSAAKLAASGL